MHRIIIQNTVNKLLVPKAALLRKWAKTALTGQSTSVEVTIRIVGIEEMAALNETYRHKKGATNVLSFPFEMPEDFETDTILLGDIVICAEVVNTEAKAQHKSNDAHWAHMVIHGIYHLLGYDHENDKDAAIMETLEIETLQKLKFKNPYETGDAIKNYE